MRLRNVILATSVAALMCIAAAPAAAQTLPEGQVTVSGNLLDPQTVSIGSGPLSYGIAESVDVVGETVTFETDRRVNFGAARVITLTYEWEAVPRRIVGTTDPVVDRKTEEHFGNFVIESFTENSVTFRYNGLFLADGGATFELVTEPIGTPTERLGILLAFIQEDLAEATAEVVRGDAEGARSFLDSIDVHITALGVLAEDPEFGPGSPVAKQVAKIERSVAKARKSTAGTTLRKVRAAQRIVKVAVLIDRLLARLQL